MSQKDVKISFSGTTISVDKDKVSVKKNDDTVGWSGSVKFSILNLPGGTVESREQGSNWIATAGPWSTTGTMKYDIAASGYDTLDPQIEVLPDDGP